MFKISNPISLCSKYLTPHFLDKLSERDSYFVIIVCTTPNSVASEIASQPIMIRSLRSINCIFPNYSQTPSWMMFYAINQLIGRKESHAITYLLYYLELHQIWCIRRCTTFASNSVLSTEFRTLNSE